MLSLPHSFQTRAIISCTYPLALHFMKRRSPLHLRSRPYPTNTYPGSSSTSLLRVTFFLPLPPPPSQVDKHRSITRPDFFLEAFFIDRRNETTDANTACSQTHTSRLPQPPFTPPHQAMFFQPPKPSGARDAIDLYKPTTAPYNPIRILVFPPILLYVWPILALSHNPTS